MCSTRNDNKNNEKFELELKKSNLRVHNDDER